MNIRTVPSLAEPVGMLWQSLQAKSDIFHVAVPLSSTPLPVYQWVIENADSFSGWPQVRFVLMDEQVDGQAAPFEYVHLDDSASYEGFARKHFLEPFQPEPS